MNPHIGLEDYYLPYSKKVLEQLSQSNYLVFSIDGSVVGNGCMCLMFSVIYKNKALPIVWEVYKAKKGHLAESSHQNLLKELASLVPKGCRVVIVGDGEFDGCDWISDITNLGWDYVLKTGKSSCMEEAGWDDFKAGEVCLEEGTDLYFEDIQFTKKSS